MLINVHIRSFTIKIFPKVVSLQKFLQNIKIPLISNMQREIIPNLRSCVRKCSITKCFLRLYSIVH